MSSSGSVFLSSNTNSTNQFKVIYEGTKQKQTSVFISKSLWKKIPLVPMGVLAPRSAHARPSACVHRVYNCDNCVCQPHCMLPHLNGASLFRHLFILDTCKALAMAWQGNLASLLWLISSVKGANYKRTFFLVCHKYLLMR